MNTLQRASDSVARRGSSVDNDPHTPPTIAMPTAAHRFSIADASAWRGSLNVEEEAPKKVHTQTFVTPVNSSITTSGTDTRGNHDAVKKKRDVARKTTASTSAAAAPRTSALSKGKSTAITTTTKNEPKWKKKRTTVIKVPTTAAASGLSLSTTPVVTTRSTVFTATNKAVSQQEGYNTYRNHRTSQGSLQEAPGARWHLKVGETDSSRSNNSNGNHSYHHYSPSRNTNNSEDMIELGMPLHTHIVDGESDFGLQVQETLISTTTPTSLCGSVAAAKSLRTAVSLPPTTNISAPRDQVEDGGWVRLSSQLTSLEENNDYNNGSGNSEHVLAPEKTEHTGIAGPFNSSGTSSLSTTDMCCTSPRETRKSVSISEDAKGLATVAAALAASSLENDALKVAAESSSQTKRFTRSAHDKASSSLNSISEEREGQTTLDVLPSCTPVENAVLAAPPMILTPAVSQNDKSSKEEEPNEASDEVSAEVAVETPAVQPAEAQAQKSFHSEVGEEDEGRVPINKPLKIYPTHTPTDVEKKTAETKPKDEKNNCAVDQAAADFIDGDSKTPGEKARSTEAVFFEDLPATTSAPPPPEASTVQMRKQQQQIPHYMTGTSARPIVGLSSAAAPAVVSIPAASTASLPAHNVSRARARLTSAPSLEHLSASPRHRPASSLSHPQPPLQKPTSLPLSARSPTKTSMTTVKRNFQRSSSDNCADPQRSNSSFTLPVQAIASQSESSVVRRRARHIAATAEARNNTIYDLDGNSNNSAVASSVNGTPMVSTFRCTSSEPNHVRSYGERQKSYARPSRDASVQSARRRTKTAASKTSSPAAPPLSSPSPQEEQQPAVLSFELMDRCIYQAVMVDPPTINERRVIPPVMERPLSYYEQGMYNRHREHAATHYKNVLLHEQRALLRNTVWLPVSRILDQRSGGVGAMMMDDFRHMARVIRYAQELENWKAALKQRARYDAHCTELIHAAAMRSSTVLINSMESVSLNAASPKAASPSVHRDSYLMKCVYHGDDADALEMGNTTTAFGDDPSLSTTISQKSNVRARTPFSQNLTDVSNTATAAVGTATTSPAVFTSSPTCRASSAAVKSADAQQHQRVDEQGSGGLERRKFASHNPDYSDSDVDEGGTATSKNAKQQRPCKATQSVSTEPKPNVTTRIATGNTKTSASSPSPLVKQPTTSPTKEATGGSHKKTEVKDREKKKKEKADSPTFLDWLAEAFGSKKSKKRGKDRKSENGDKTKCDHQKTKFEAKPTAAARATAESKSVAKTELYSSSSPALPKPLDHKKAASPRIPAKPTSAVTTTAQTSNELAAAVTIVKLQHSQPPTTTETAASASQQKPGSNVASPSPQPPLNQHAVMVPARVSTMDFDATKDMCVVAGVAPETTTGPSTSPADATSPFTEDLHVSRFPVRSARCCSVELPPAPVPVFRLYNFHPFEVVQELKRMVWWAATHRFMIFRVLTGTTATTLSESKRHSGDGQGFHSHNHHHHQFEDEDENGDCVDPSTRSVSRRRAAAMEAAATGRAGGTNNGTTAATTTTILASYRNDRRHEDDDELSPFSSFSRMDSGSSSLDSLDAVTGGSSHHDAVYFNTVLLNLRVDQWLVQHVVLTRRDAARGLVELEVTEAAEDEAADAVEREMAMLEAMQEPSVGQPSNGSIGTDRHAISAMTYFFNSDTKTPR